MTKEEKYSHLLRRVLLFFLGAILLWLLFRLFFDLLLPFTAAFFSALLLSPLSKRLGKKTKMSLRALRLLILFFLMAVLSLLLIWGAIRLFDEAGTFFLSFYDRFESTLNALFSFLDRVKEKLPISSATAEEVAGIVNEALRNAMSEISSRSAALAARLAARLPSMLFSLLIFLLALFYFSFDYDKVTAYLVSLVPPRLRPRLQGCRDGFFGAVKRFLRAYFLLYLITFSQLYLAFIFLRVEYAALLALIAATLDILPAVGVGIVLVPWAIALFIGGSTGRAVAILVIYLAVTLIRQIIEPHIIGAHFGIHPLASLIALYAGFRLFGVLGILLSPFFALIVSQALAFYRKKIGENEPETPP